MVDTSTTSPPEPENRAAPVGRLFLTIFATAIVLCAAALALPHNPYIRFQQLAKTIQFGSQWIYERVDLDPAPIDVVIVGNSRLGAGVSGPQLQAALRQKTGDATLRVANVSMPQEGRNIHYVIVKRLLERHPEVKLIVLSAIEQMPRDGHPAFRDLADTGDVLGAPILINRDYANDVGILPYRQMSLFVQTRWPGLFGDVTRLDPRLYRGTDFDQSATFRLPDGKIVDRDTIQDRARLAATASERLRSITRPLLPASAADYEFAIERSYTRRIAAMARARGVSVMFLYLPIYTDREKMGDLDFYQEIGPVLRPDFLDGDYRLYSDYAHLNRYGTAKATAWLADQIVALGNKGRIRRLTDRPAR